MVDSFLARRTERIRPICLVALSVKVSRPVGSGQRKDLPCHAAIAAGNCPIRLQGYTSTPGSEAHNLALSNKRIDGIAAAIRNLFADAAKAKVRFDRKADGKSVPKIVGAAAQERWGVLVISENDAARAYAK